MANYPKGSTGDQSARNQKLAAAIYLGGFALLHVLAFVLSAHPNFYGWRVALFGVAVVAVLALAISFFRNADLTEDFRWPEVVVIILAFASAVAIGYCPTC